MRTTFIYALYSPINGELRYIGKSDNPASRLNSHCRSVSREAGTRKARWIKSLNRMGLRPTVGILSEVAFEHWQAEEIFFIAVFRALGARLVNATDGGDGVTHTPEIRAKMSRAARNPSPETRAKRSENARNRSPGTLAKMSVAAKRRVYTAEQKEWIRNLAKLRTIEHIQKMASSLKGRKIPPEVLAKRTASVLGSKRSEETKARMAAAQRGKKATDETRAKLSAAHKGRTLPPEQRAKMAESHKQRWAKIKALQQQQANHQDLVPPDDQSASAP